MFTPAIKRNIGIGQISCATLIFEIALTRVCSISIWYHFAFMVMSITLLGLGASGAMLSVFPSLHKNPDAKLSWCSLGFGISAVGAYLLTQQLPLDPFQMFFNFQGMLAPNLLQFVYLLIYYGAMIVPFFFSGMVIGLLFTVEPERVTTLYFADLLGAALGCLMAAVLLSGAGAPTAILVAGVLGVSCVNLFEPNHPKLQKLFNLVDKRVPLPGFNRRQTILGVSLVALTVLFQIPNSIEVRPAPSKGLSWLFSLRPETAEIIHSEWNMISRIDVTELVPGGDAFYLPGMGKGWEQKTELPHQRFISIDGDAFSMMNNLEGIGPEGAEFIDYALYSTAYQVKGQGNKVLCVGLGGGSDILTALRYDSESVTGVEINPGSINVTKNVFSDWVGNLYQDPRVNIVNEEGRSYLRRHAGGDYDIIQMSGVDTWSGLAAGAYTLSENYLYTVDAFEDYLNALHEDGMLSMIRYIFRPPRETLRLCSLARAALQRVTGKEDVSNHIIVISNYGAEPHPYASFLFKKSEFTREEVERVRAFANKAGFTIRYLPTKFYHVQSPFTLYLAAPDKEVVYDDYIYNIRPVDDNQPFFFKYYKWANILSAPAGHGGNLGANIPIGHLVIVAVFVQALFFCVILILGPLWKFSSRGLSIDGAPTYMVYFMCLGVGFMFIELTMIQKLILFLGHPTYAVTVVLFAFLLSTGGGSYLAGKLGDPRKLLLISLPVLVVTTLIYTYFTRDVMMLFLHLAKPIRLVLTMVMILPLGLLMGMCFPSGIQLLNRGGRRPFIPWAWGVNGCTSVLGSVGTTMVAMTFGFQAAMLTGAALYALAWVCIYYEPSPSEDQQGDSDGPTNEELAEELKPLPQG